MKWVKLSRTRSYCHPESETKDLPGILTIRLSHRYHSIIGRVVFANDNPIPVILNSIQDPSENTPTLDPDDQACSAQHVQSSTDAKERTQNKIGS
jgi:hypothetical protein